MSWQTFQKWMWFAEMEPLDRDVYQLAYIAQILTNLHRDTKKHQQPYPLKDFVLNFDPEEKKPAAQQTPEYIMMVLDSWIFGHNEALKAKGQWPASLT